MNDANRARNDMRNNNVLKEQRRAIRFSISYIKTVRQHPAHFDGRYIGGAAQCESEALAGLRYRITEHRAFHHRVRVTL